MPATVAGICAAVLHPGIPSLQALRAALAVLVLPMFYASRFGNRTAGTDRTPVATHRSRTQEGD